MSKRYDGIVIGAGHNGLILQCYLARAGLKVLCLERRSVVGGGAATLEDPGYPGFLHNTHAFFQRAITGMPWYRDLDLQRHGLDYIEPELNATLLTKDDRSLQWWTDFDRTNASFAEFSKKDAATLTRWYEDFLPIVRDILVWEGRSPPLRPETRRELLERSKSGRKLLEVSALSPLEFVHTEFENPTIQAGLLFFNGLREVDLRVRGFGHHIAALLASPAKAQISRGGTVALARALERTALESGGEIRMLTEPSRIVVADGKVKGVEISTGEYIEVGGFVVSSLNPHQTFLQLLDESDLPRSIRDHVENFNYNLLAPLFSLNLNLREAPSYKASASQPEINQALMVIMGLDHVDQYPDIVRHHEAGTIPPPVMWGSCPTVFDSTQAPTGYHTGFMWEKVPYLLDGNSANWDGHRKAHGERMLELWTRHAPNLADAVISSFVRSPLDVERSLHTMKYGDLLIGAFTNDQIGHNRPFPGAGEYRAHIKGLYLCGSSSHPGGNITGLPGYNAAQVILADLGLKADWAPPPIADRLAALA